MVDVVSGLSTVFTAALGGVISSSVITYALGARRAEREVLRNKLESLYTDLSREMRLIHVRANACADDVWKLEQAQETIPESEDPKDAADVEGAVSYDKYSTLINIYFPKVVPAYQAFFTVYQAINGLHIRTQVELLLSNKISVSRYDEILKKVEELTPCIKAVHSALMYEADKINCPLWRRPFLKIRHDPTV
ncbi:hypothetical protein [Pseudomonas yamanorum]|uniref:hypothetical protein n=1 Tax=Pseudomonas yamanorum TaxID=515393 RepID=UPI002ED4054C|nr:hypothetical protein VYI69_13680 [Pseudomonas yamanorum]